MAKSKEDIMKMDLYGILGVSSGASEKEIVKAYRKKALKCHPDKNPDNPKAAELFHELSKALEVLTDPPAKAAYDNVLKAKKLAEERNRELDSKRRKLKDDLEARERHAEHRRTDDNKAQQNLLAEIERLRKEGSKLLEQEQQYMRQQMKDAADAGCDDSDSDNVETPKIKIRWNAKQGSAYDEEDLTALFSRYGQIANIIVSTKKKGSAIIEYECVTPLLKLADNEKGTNSNPLTVAWLSGKPSSKSTNPVDRQPNTKTTSATPLSTATFSGSSAQSTGFSSTTDVPNDRDFESLVLMKMRQAEERKRLIEQMQKEDEDEEQKV